MFPARLLRGAAAGLNPAPLPNRFGLAVKSPGRGNVGGRVGTENSGFKEYLIFLLLKGGEILSRLCFM